MTESACITKSPGRAEVSDVLADGRRTAVRPHPRCGSARPRSAAALPATPPSKQPAVDVAAATFSIPTITDPVPISLRPQRLYPTLIGTTAATIVDIVMTALARAS